MAIKNKKTIMGKHALILIARGEKEIASQIFQYEQMREVRVNLEILEVKVLMTYDESYIRVFSINLNEEAPEAEVEKAKENVMKFYNELLNGASRLTKEEHENIAKQDAEREKSISAKKKIELDK